LVAVLLLALLAAVLLERASLLPEPLARMVRAVEEQLEPVLREVGIVPPEEGPGPAQPRSGGDEEAASAAQALSLLDRVRVEPERPRGYDREDWPHWLDLDGDCMDARQEVLLAESPEPVRLSADGCRVVSGVWRDLYTGETFTDPQTLDVDHFIPLAEAHRSGGYAWTTERRVAFANDLEDSRSLVAVSASANRSKGDQGPEEWLPPNAGIRCRYAADWVAVKVRWSLSMDERERVTLSNLLRACARG
jgi:hypothetical protein